jgi:hypothetical protein
MTSTLEILDIFLPKLGGGGGTHLLAPSFKFISASPTTSKVDVCEDISRFETSISPNL